MLLSKQTELWDYLHQQIEDTIFPMLWMTYLRSTRVRLWPSHFVTTKWKGAIWLLVGMIVFDTRLRQKPILFLMKIMEDFTK